MSLSLFAVGSLTGRYDTTSSSLISVHADQNIIFHSLTSSTHRQIIGFNDEIIDATFLSDSTGSQSRLALATNSSLIRLYSTDKLDSMLLSGHGDMVLCLDKSADQAMASKRIERYDCANMGSFGSRWRVGDV